MTMTNADRQAAYRARCKAAGKKIVKASGWAVRSPIANDRINFEFKALVCCECGAVYSAKRFDSLTCSAACRKRISRKGGLCSYGPLAVGESYWSGETVNDLCRWYVNTKGKRAFDGGSNWRGWGFDRRGETGGIVAKRGWSAKREEREALYGRALAAYWLKIYGTTADEGMAVDDVIERVIKAIPSEGWSTWLLKDVWESYGLAAKVEAARAESAED